ncbi:MAG: transcriptional repressor [Bacillales bacterium]|jgi:Fur family peroxide stress response transcriptional regulator|nr:transcriptional repressor [Bacillales bacterium]
MQSTLFRDAINALKKTGVRMTPQRYAILEYLSSTQLHPTADDIFKALEVNFPSMSVATVYNNLRVFKDTGLVNELNYGDASSRFDFATHDHYHILCQSCGKIVDFQYPGLDSVENVAAHLTGFRVATHRLEIYGECPDCLA